MSLLVVGRGWRPEEAGPSPSAGAAISEARRQGFAAPESFHWDGGGAYWFATAGNPRGSGASLRRAGRFAAYVGTVQWRGLTGAALLERLLELGTPPAELPLDEFAGSFAMLLGLGSDVWLFNDALGIQKLYETDDRALISTSLMMCRATLSRPGVNRLRAQEYILLGANHGDATPIDGVRIADPTLARELVTQRALEIHSTDRLRSPCRYASRAQAVQGLCEETVSIFGDYVKAFGSDIGMALSGGFDSRLLLAALDRLGVAPALYVYGAPQDDDVRVAQVVAAGLGMPIESIDKRALDANAPPLSLVALQEKLAFFDGLPADGAFDFGSDRRTRLEQVSGGRLNLNGGGGEILRDFFYLRDRPYDASELVGAFYSNWRAQVFPSAQERLAFLEAMRAGILRSLGFADGHDQPLSRSDVELVYSVFRLRYWMGRNNTIAARYGAFLTPFADARLARLTAALPLAWKEFGRLEAEIITALSPRVARGPSGYGFDFSTGPDARHCARVAATLYRPLAIRRRSAALRRMLGRSQAVQMPQRWRDLAASLPPQDWVDAAELTEIDQLNRLLTLQALLSPQHCGVALSV